MGGTGKMHQKHGHSSHTASAANSLHEIEKRAATPNAGCICPGIQQRVKVLQLVKAEWDTTDCTTDRLNIIRSPTSNRAVGKRTIVLVIGGDCDVGREALMHDTVEQVVFCDLDEQSTRHAVVRIQMFLPHMSELRADPRVTVDIEDGFKFLAHKELALSPPTHPTPANRSFQKPYFQLTHDALTPGGHIPTQSMPVAASRPHKWPAQEIFTTSESGVSSLRKQGFKVAIMDAQGCRYYNRAIHSAPFVLPELTEAMEEGKGIRPVFERALKGMINNPTKKILLLGTCGTLASAQGLAQSLPSTTPISLDMKDREAFGCGSCGARSCDLPHPVHLLWRGPQGSLGATFRLQCRMRKLDVGIPIVNNVGLKAYGKPGGHSAMAWTVVPSCGVATQLVLDGGIRKLDVHAPYTKDVWDPFREVLERNGCGRVERAL
ncbi:hypothetical protein FA15DRAFT_698599 [Coprinopsis marcescibilis]|uniref:Saccharopine dehydrogenase-like C-terminal domain-containing protein n=1 Tax=Coprinopsis marcescibilis TaxID=230819 RepID=A0A5C3KBJ0_COPMA|nr:hypothetical protein FA15DRAFT_698599 [Coprinopsis marcescibilis]